jgi:hypothetical protein
MNTNQQTIEISCHPWNRAFNNRLKLKAARELGRKRYEKKWYKENRDELSRLLRTHQNYKSYRKRNGLPLDAPPAKPWDFVKGRNTNKSSPNQLHRPA